MENPAPPILSTASPVAPMVQQPGAVTATTVQQTTAAATNFVAFFVQHMIVGIAIGAGFIISQRIFKKRVIAESKTQPAASTSNFTAAPGENYPKRNHQRYPDRPVEQYPHPQNSGPRYVGNVSRMGYRGFDGKKNPSFDINSWREKIKN